VPIPDLTVTGPETTGARLARVQDRRGQRDAATQTLTQVADDVVGVQSERVRRELHALPRHLLPAALQQLRTT
jgi:hypothetical protein